MNELDDYPYGCEIDAIMDSAISACDNLDGVIDGVLSLGDKCLGVFGPFSVVGKKIQCAQLNNTRITVGKAAATVVHATWHGMTTKDGKRSWHGILPGTDLTGSKPASFEQAGVAAMKANPPNTAPSD
jgi:hypothetical protein